MKRLFLFAGYNAHGRIPDSDRYYINELAECGDVIVVTDNELPEAEKRRLEGRVLHVEACRHGEYDFGSYKRAYLWAEKHLKLEDYDYIYMVNDSVIGPLSSLDACLQKLEFGGSDFVGMVYNPHRKLPHLQTWFVGIKKPVFMADWFRSFIGNVGVAESKGEICIKYETGLTELMLSRGIRPHALFTIPGKQIYNSPLKNVRMGLPFVKKDSFKRHNGALGFQIGRLINEIDSERNAVITHFMEETENQVVTDSRAVSAMRYLEYLRRKIFGSK